MFTFSFGQWNKHALMVEFMRPFVVSSVHFMSFVVFCVLNFKTLSFVCVFLHLKSFFVFPFWNHKTLDLFPVRFEDLVWNFKSLPFRLLFAFRSYVNRIWKAKLLKSFRRVRKTNSDRPAVCRLCFCILCAEQNIRAISHLVTEVKVIAFRRVTLAQNNITSKCIMIVFGVCVVWSRFEVLCQYIYSAPASLLQHSHPLWTF